MALRFGLALMNDFAPHISPSSRIGQMREQVRAARDAGMHSIWVLNHYLGNMATMQPLVTLAALAEHAGEMKLGTNMFILPLRHPVAVAEEFATLDHITGGNVIAGFGMGYRGNEYAAFGIPMEQRVARYEESVELIRRLWRAEPVTFEGEHFTVRGERIGIPPVQPGGPRIWVGAGVHKTGARRAARLGDTWIIPRTPRWRSWCRTCACTARSANASAAAPPTRSWYAASWSSTTTRNAPARSAWRRARPAPACTPASRRPTTPTRTGT
ncbi:LLM class flavin-dependent oxidoreductase [Thermocatellispora tengchongensis]|uniref:LLM class flavin-dependent oxidoreductase n=1 Tax=Thermocatellispora tengchongensis TaxID=1073253 RepID=UPI003625A4B5